MGGSIVKLCRYCDYNIPEHAQHCPHCRKRAKHGEWFPQLILVASTAAAAVAVLADGCPLSLG